MGMVTPITAPTTKVDAEAWRRGLFCSLDHAVGAFLLGCCMYCTCTWCRDMALVLNAPRLACKRKRVAVGSMGKSLLTDCNAQHSIIERDRGVARGVIADAPVREREREENTGMRA